jgi:hypothetical protein
MKSLEPFIRSYEELLEQQVRNACPNGSDCSLDKVNAHATPDLDDPDLHQITASFVCTTECPYFNLPTTLQRIIESASQLAIQHSETNAAINYFE